jgi:hypothetical protein
MTIIHLSYLAHLFFEREMFYIKPIQKIKTQMSCHNFFFENRVVYDMWKNTVQPDMAKMIIWRICTESLISKGYKHTFKIRNSHRLSTATKVAERPSVLRNTYIVCLVHVSEGHVLTLLQLEPSFGVWSEATVPKIVG